MKDLIFIAYLLFTAVEAKSQFVLGATGGEGNVGNININYTVGETAITTISNDSSTLTQGFHQPQFVFTSVNESFLLGEVIIYPNPTKSILFVQFNDKDFSDLNISIHSSAGREILNTKVITSIWQTDLSILPDGFYVVTVTDIKSKKRNSYKIFKSN
ncbi:MAG TPA: T9SS type A sorting domain-containing protein [Saprospiraceae bacterium]|nr:T9SS type A sorting domain-containing protein [Saprospiraceae bacterium]